MSSKKIDERVVEMRFDNSKFEKNVQTSMSTLEKLKQSLKFPNSTKGLENIAATAKKVDFSGMAKGIETVNARFSNLQVVGMTALSNITTAAMQAGKNLVSSFTIDPIISGFREYETQINAVQTIMANTKSKGTTMDQVTAALDELNEYADLTIYNFAEMTKNIGTFTAAGVDLEPAVAAIKGIANLGAMSGSTAMQVNTAMYQLSQALATGRVSLMDWNSVVNAGMGGEQFQNALKRTAENFGYDVDSMIKKYGSFRESLTRGGWLTAEVLTETLNQLGGAYSEADLLAKGYSAEQAKAIVDMANTATDAATKVKTFTQLMDTLMEAAGSGWAKTWQLIFGDFEEAKEFFTDLSDMLSGIIGESADSRNSVIEAAMSGGGASRWGEFTSELDKAGVSIDTFQKKLSEVASTKGVSLDSLIKEYGSLEKAIGSGKISADMITQSLSELSVSTDKAAGSTKELAEWQKVVDDVWRGDYGNIDTGRMEKLAAAGWEYAEVQKLVNMTVDGHRLTLEDLSEAQIVSMGYTKEQAAALVEFANEAKKADTPLNQLINDLVEPKKSGRELFLESIKNILTAIIKPLQAVGKAFGDVFGLNADELYDLIKGFHDFTETIVMSDETAENLTKTMRGLFSILHLVTTVAGGAFKIVFSVINSVLGLFGTNLLAVTGGIGDAIYYFEQFITSGNLISGAIHGIGSAFSWAVKPVSEFFGNFTNLPVVSSVITNIKNFFDTIIGYFALFEGLSVSEIFTKLVEDAKNAFNKLKSLRWEDVLAGLSGFGSKVGDLFNEVVNKIKEVGPNILEGLQNGLKDGVTKAFEIMQDIGQKIIEAICAVLGIHSPSTVMFEIGQNIVQGLINGIQSIIGGVAGAFTGIAGEIRAVFDSIDWGAVAVIATAAASFVTLYKFTDALQGFAVAAKNVTAPAAGVGKVLTSVSETIDNFNGRMKGSTKLQGIAVAVKMFAEAIAILSAAIVALTIVDQSKLLPAIGSIAALAAVMAVLIVVLDKFTGDAKLIDAAKIGTLVLSISAAFVLLAVAAKVMGGVDDKGFAKGGIALIAFGAVVAALVAVSKVADEKQLAKVSKIIMSVAASLLILSVAARIIGSMNSSSLEKAGGALVAFGIVVAALITVTQFSGKSLDGAAQFMAKIALAFLALAVVAKVIGDMSWSEMAKAGVGIGALTVVIMALVGITNIASEKKIESIGSTIMQIGVAMGILAVVAKLISGMTWSEMGKAAAGLLGLTAIVGLLVAITNVAPKSKLVKVNATLLTMSLSIGILAGVAMLLGMVNPETFVKGLIAITALVAMMTALTAVTRLGKRLRGDMFLGLAATIGVLAVSLVALSFVEPSKLYSAVGALSAVMAVFGIVLKLSSTMSQAMGTLIVMTAAVAILGGVLIALTVIDPQGALQSALGMSALLLSLSVSMAILSKISPIASEAIAGALLMVAVMASIALVFMMLQTTGTEIALESALGLSVVLLALSGALAILSTVGAAAIPALVGIGVALVAVTAIGLVIAAVAALANDENIAAVQKAGEMMEAVGNAIGSFVGGLIGGVAEGIMGALPGMADSLSDFITRLQPFLDGVKSVDDSTLAGVQSLAMAMLALSGAGLLSTITNFISFGRDPIVEFADSLAALGSGLVNFGSVTSGLNAEQTAAAAGALKTVAEALSQIPNSGGWLGEILGGKDYSSFSAGMASVGMGLTSFATATAGITAEEISPRAEALKTLIQAMADVPNSGGWLEEILGGKDYSAFADGMVSIAEGLVAFATNTDGITAEEIGPRADALKALIEAMAGVPNSGGFLDKLFGTQDFGNFAEGMKSIGNAMKEFYTATSSITDPETFTAVVTATKTLIEGLGGIKESGGWLDTLFGKQDFDSFSASLSGLGNAVKGFWDATSGITDLETLNLAVTATKNLINGLAGITSTSGLLETMMGGEEFGTFKTALTNIGDAVVSFASSTAETSFENIGPAIDAAKKILDFINATSEINTEGVDSFKNAVDSLASANISGMVETFSSASGDMIESGRGLIGAVADGIGQNASSVRTAIESAIGDAKSTAEQKTTDFVSVGSSINTKEVEGVNSNASTVGDAVVKAVADARTRAETEANTFGNVGKFIVDGIRNAINQYAQGVADAAADMVRKAKQAADDAGGIESPSKEFYKTGRFLVMGLTNALDDGQRSSYRSGYALADNAKKGLTKSITALSSVLDLDVDSNPTITPVVDLTNVRSSAAAIGGMLGGMVPVGVVDDANRLSYNMNRPNQNGSLNDVVSSINKLRGDLAEFDRTQYNINGITYDDGSNIATAVGDLTRAIRIERRI